MNDKPLLSHRITLEVGHVKNPNKNPVAERAVEELGMELLHLSPEGGPTSAVSLALATANMNSRIGRDGLSAHEVWTQRDQLTDEQLPIVDRQLMLSQNFSRKLNHLPSAKSKARGRSTPSTAPISVGDLVFLKGDKDKLKAGDKYLVIAINENLTCQLRMFTTSQFRSKVYTVPTSECYRVCPTVLVESPLGHHEPSQDDSDDEPDPATPLRGLLLPPLPHMWTSSLQFVHLPLILFIILYLSLHLLGILPQSQQILFHSFTILFQIAFNHPAHLCCLLSWNLQEDPVANVKPHFGIVKTGSLNRDLNIVFIRFISLILRDKPRTLTSRLCSFVDCSLISFISLILRDKPRTLVARFLLLVLSSPLFYLPCTSIFVYL